MPYGSSSRPIFSIKAGTRQTLARQVPHPADIQLKMAPAPVLALRADCLRFGRLRCLLHLREHLANSFVGPGAALLAPCFQAITLFFQVGEEVRAAEHRAPRGEHRFHLFKHRPLFPVAFEEELLFDQPTVHDAGHHLPVTEHHAHVSIFLGARRTHAHQVVRRFHVEVGREPVARFSQLRFAPLLIQPQHQIHLLVRYFAHVSSFEFGTDFFATGFTPIFFTTTAANPPVDITPTIISAALAMHAGHMNSYPLPAATLTTPSLHATDPLLPASSRPRGYASSHLTLLFDGLTESVQPPCGEK